MSIKIKNLTFGYTDPIITDLSCTFNHGWSAIVGANGSGKTTLLRLISGKLKPDSGSIEVGGGLLHCTQIPDDIPSSAVNLLSDNSSFAYKIRLKFDLHDSWLSRWETLSFGERKRIQTACVFYAEPEVLLLDEPTNHLDAESRNILIAALQSYEGTGVLVSHDRQLLDKLSQQTLFLESPGHYLRSQPYTEAQKSRALESAHRREQRDIIRKEVKRLENRASRYRSLASGADKRKSKRSINRRDHDAKARMDLARLTGKDAIHGKLMNQMQGRIKQENDKLDGLRTDKDHSFNFSMHFTPGRRKNLFKIDEGRLSMGEKSLHFSSFQLNPEDKAALTGVNGSGKSTLLSYIYAHCRKEQTLYIPQELDQKLIDKFFKRINEMNSNERGEIFSIMAALGSDPGRVLTAQHPSPGEIRKLLIAEAIRKRIELLLLDEPTNHLDIGSIEAIESALSEYRAGLVLVSHDQYFLEGTTELKWEIKCEKENDYRLIS